MVNESVRKGDVLQMNNAEFLPYVVELANSGHEVTIPLRGVSMRPYLEDRRDNAILVSVTSPLKVGDVVLAEIFPGQFVLHRIMEIKGDKVELQGDGNLIADGLFPYSCVKLIAKGFYRKGSNKFSPVEGRYFRVYSWSWMRLKPMRRYLLAAWRRLPETLRNALV